MAEPATTTADEGRSLEYLAFRRRILASGSEEERKLIEVHERLIALIDRLVEQWETPTAGRSPDPRPSVEEAGPASGPALGR